jgi:PIN domain nuclease of toxin-antitoxin system
LRVLLDTPVLVRAYLGDPLPRKVYTLLSDPETTPLLSTVSMMEVALKHEAGKLDMGARETQEAIRDLGLAILPFSGDHALRLYGLPRHHADPFDRMLIATALSEEIPLVGSDRQFKKYKPLQVIW